MAEPANLEPRVAALEVRVDRAEGRVTAVQQDAATTRQILASIDRDLTDLGAKVADLGVKVDANRKVINALSVQTAEGFAESRRRFDQTAAGHQLIVDLLTRALGGEEG